MATALARAGAAASTLALVSSVLVPSGAGAESASGITQAQDCRVARIVETAYKERRLAPGLTLRTWKDQSSQTIVLHVKARLSRATPVVVAARPGAPQSVEALSKTTALAVNAGYLDENTGLPKGPLAGRSVLVAGDGSYLGRNRQALILEDESAYFGKTRLEGTVAVGQDTWPILGVGTLTALGKGVAIVQASTLREALHGGHVPARAAIYQLRDGRLVAHQVGAAPKVDKAAKYIVTANPEAQEWLARHAGRRATASWNLLSKETGRNVPKAVPLGSAYTMDNRSRFGPCRKPSSWESRPRMAVSLSAKGSVLEILAVRGPAVPAFGQYDSGATYADMAQTALALGMHKAYALDAGASLQVLDRTGPVPKLLDRAMGQPFLWQRPVSAALGFQVKPKASERK